MGIVNLCFADDLLIFCKANPQSVSCLMQAFRDFSETSGLRANPTKSALYMCGIPKNMKMQLLSLTSFRRGEFPMKYLGIPLTSRRWTNAECYGVVQKITDRMNGWASKTYHMLEEGY